jgi:hypothetical protein
MQILLAQNASNVGASFYLQNTAGTTKLNVSLSSNGTTNDIVGGGLGTSSTWATGTTYHLCITYDTTPATPVYRIYKDGVQDFSIASASKVCAITKIRLGVDSAAGSGVNGAMAGFRFLPYCAYPNGTTFTAPTISTFTVNSNVSSDFFSIPAMTMYGVTVASASAGTNPTLTAKNVMYHGEAVTGAANVASVVNYAYKGQYIGADTTIPAVGTRTAFNANMGTQLVDTSAWIRNTTTDAGYAPGEIEPGVINSTAPGHNPVSITDRNVLGLVTGATAVFSVPNKTTGAATSITTGNWKMFVIAQRKF